MPYRYGKSKKAASFNIRSLHHGPRYKKNVRKYGKAKANKIAIAAGFSIARRGKKRRKK